MIKTEMYIVPRLNWWLGHTEGGVTYHGNTLRLRFAGVDFVAVRPVSSALCNWALEAILD